MTELASNDGGTRAQHTTFGGLVALLVIAGIYTLFNFLSALAWAAIFAVALWPLYRRAIRRFGERGALWPIVFTLGVALVFLVPLGLVGLQLAREAHQAATFARNAQEHGIPVPDMVHRLPAFGTQVASWWQTNLADPQAARALLERTTHGRIEGTSRIIAGQVARRSTLFVFTLLTLFFLFREGHDLTQQMRRATARAFGPGGEHVGLQMIASIHGTVNGLVLVGLGEGVIIGIAYVIGGVPHPTVLGALTALAAMVPFAAPVVVGIAGLLLAAGGSVGWGIGIFLFGISVTFIADHFVRPVLIGGATKLPFLWVLLGILGGLEAWGLIGLFLGPAIMAALILLWRQFVGEQRQAVLF